MEHVTRFGFRPARFISSTTSQTLPMEPRSLRTRAWTNSLYVTWFGAWPASRMARISARAFAKPSCRRCALISVLNETTSATSAPCISRMSSSARARSRHSTQASSAEFQIVRGTSVPVSRSVARTPNASRRLPRATQPRIMAMCAPASVGLASSIWAARSWRPHCRAALARHRSVRRSSRARWRPRGLWPSGPDARWFCTCRSYKSHAFWCSPVSQRKRSSDKTAVARPDCRERAACSKSRWASRRSRCRGLPPPPGGALLNRRLASCTSSSVQSTPCAAISPSRRATRASSSSAARRSAW
mmetsp:Transcript_59349/g.180997  ORF Transcript_59349/g.180997 Transcript_59349/m.180997 type:complete len:302 (-) Transcript_59349:14-919(-)